MPEGVCTVRRCSGARDVLSGAVCVAGCKLGQARPYLLLPGPAALCILAVR